MFADDVIDNEASELEVDDVVESQAEEEVLESEEDLSEESSSDPVEE
jgi:hypothetical protein